MPLRNKLIVWAVIVGAALLIGFVPQYLETRRVRGELERAQEQAHSLQSTMRLAGLRDLFGLVYLETNQKNYGTAQQRSSQFFSRAREVAGETSDANLKRLLEDVLKRRDDITAGLAKGDGAIREEVENLYRKILEGTGPK